MSVILSITLDFLMTPTFVDAVLLTWRVLDAQINRGNKMGFIHTLKYVVLITSQQEGLRSEAGSGGGKKHL